jgi:hypothetical protein
MSELHFFAMHNGFASYPRVLLLLQQIAQASLISISSSIIKRLHYCTTARSQRRQCFPFFAHESDESPQEEDN